MSNPNLTWRAIEDRVRRIEQYYEKHDKDKQKTFDHFMDEGINKRTISNILKRIEEPGLRKTSRKPAGRKASVCTPEMFEKVAELFKHNKTLTCKDGAKQLGIARTTIFRIMAKMREQNIETYRVVESEPRCPTCHQKVDQKTLDNINKRRNKKKQKLEKDSNYDMPSVNGENSNIQVTDVKNEE